jgi:hypothetical protein
MDLATSSGFMIGDLAIASPLRDARAEGSAPTEIRSASTIFAGRIAAVLVSRTERPASGQLGSGTAGLRNNGRNYVADILLAIR